MSTPAHNPRRHPWLVPLLWSLAILCGTLLAAMVNETAREVVFKAVMMIAGALCTPFILETSIAVAGLAAVLTYNHWRMQKDGDGWLEMEINDDKPGQAAPHPPGPEA